MDTNMNQDTSILEASAGDANIKKSGGKGGKEFTTRQATPFSFPIALPNGQTCPSMVLDTFVWNKKWNCILDLWRPLGNTNTFSRALSGATFINDLSVTPYPEGIKTPDPYLNIAASPGKLGFLLQFMDVCKEKPDSLPPLDAIGQAPGESPANYSVNRLSGENRRVGSMGMGGAPSLSRQASMGLGLGPGLGKGGGFVVGQFQSPSRSMDPQSRFDASNNTYGAIPFAGPTGACLTPMTRSAAQAGVGGGGSRESKRTRSQHGNNRGESAMRGSGFQTQSQQLVGTNLEPVAPLEVSENRCIKKLLSNVANPQDEEIECLCRLLTTVGQTLDKPKARNHMDIYFEHMNAMVKSNTTKFRTRFLVQDVIELGENRWQPRHAVLQFDKFPQGAYSNSTEAEGRNISSGDRTRPSARGGDLSQLGKRSKPASHHFGPSSVFAKKDRRPEAGGASATNMFSAIGTSKRLEVETNNRKASPGLGLGGSPNEGGMGPARKKLNLLPRTKPIETKEVLVSPELH